MKRTLEKLASGLPRRWQQELKRRYFGSRSETTPSVPMSPNLLTDKSVLGGFLLYGLGAVVCLGCYPGGMSARRSLVGLEFAFTVAIGLMVEKTSPFLAWLVLRLFVLGFFWGGVE